MKPRRDNKLTYKRVPVMHPREFPVLVLLESRIFRDTKQKDYPSNILAPQFTKEDARDFF